jgi:hypothetical protein
LPGTPGPAYTSRPIAGVAQLVEQSLRKREVGGSSPSTGTSSPHFLFRLLLALASVVAYAVLVQFTPLLDGIDVVPSAHTLFHLLVGAIFGALVLAPFARAPGRFARGIVLATAAAAIYYGAIRIVVDGPAGLDPLALLVIAGLSAAVLCGLAVALVAPMHFTPRLGVALAIAGAAGGAVFDVKFSFDPNLLLGHAAWQVLVFLALWSGQVARKS